MKTCKYTLTDDGGHFETVDGQWTTPGPELGWRVKDGRREPALVCDPPPLCEEALLEKLMEALRH